MTLPRPWPFMSPLAERAHPSDQQEQQEPKQCGHCGESEPWVGLCDRMGDLCGKPLIVEVS